MNAVGASPVHIDSKRWKAPRLPSSCLPSREGGTLVASSLTRSKGPG